METYCEDYRKRSESLKKFRVASINNLLTTFPREMSPYNNSLILSFEFSFEFSSLPFSIKSGLKSFEESQKTSQLC